MQRRANKDSSINFDLVETIKPAPERSGTSSQHVHRFWIQADINQ